MPKEFKITSSKTNRPIAFFDSGVGGLTVYAKLKTLLPEENYIYFGDTKHMPYGEKTEEELLKFADRIINFFIEKNAKAVVMACNTTSSVIYDKIKDKYNIKIYPIIQSAAKVLSELPIKKFGVFATYATVKSGVYKKEIQKYNKNTDVIEIACPKWVRIVEENKMNQPESILQIREKIEEMLKYNPEKIILGCTHYPYLTEVFSRFAAKELFIDPAEYFAEFIRSDLEKNNLLEKSQGKEEFYVSAYPQLFKEASQMFYSLKNVPDLALSD